MAAGGDSGDALGAYATEFRTGDRVRCYGRWLRASVAANAFLVVVVVALSMAVASMFPLKHTVPYLVQVFDDDRAVARIEPLIVERGAEALLAEKLAALYVKVRHEVVPSAHEMSRRWGTECLSRAVPVDDELCGFMWRHTSQEEYARFREGNLRPVEELLKRKRGRRVTILQDPIRRGPDEIEVRFEYVEFEGAGNDPQEIRRRRFSANLWYRFLRGRDVPRGERYVNVPGFQVLRYHLAEITGGTS